MVRPKEYFFKEGCFIEEWLNTEDDTAASIARVRVEPYSHTRLHRLVGTTERYVILSGSAEVTVGDKSWRVSEGDVVTINAMQAQKINNDQAENLIFFAICTPRFEEKNYQDLE